MMPSLLIIFESQHVIFYRHNICFETLFRVILVMHLIQASGLGRSIAGFSISCMGGAMTGNQLGRRNLTPEQVSLLRGRRYNRTKTSHGGDHKSKDQNDTLINSAETLSHQHGVSPRTIERDGQFANDVEKLNWASLKYFSLRERFSF